MIDGRIPMLMSNELEILERHLKILIHIRDNGPVGILKISKTLGFPIHKVRYSFRVLHDEGLIRPTKLGAVKTDKVNRFMKELKVLMKKLERIC
jgi:predicted transcriptional regulator